MAFWGVEVKPGTPFTLIAGDVKGRLHISQATLGGGSAITKSIVQCNLGRKSPIYLCTLSPDKVDNCQLNHEFDESDDVVFSVVGPRSVHLSGYFIGSSRANLGDNDDDHTESYGEDIGDSETEHSSEDGDDYQYSDSFIDDSDAKVASGSSIPIDSDENKTKSRRRLKKTYRASESDDDCVATSNSSSKDEKKPKSTRRLRKTYNVSEYDDTSNTSTNDKVMADSDEDDKHPVSSLRKLTHRVENEESKAKETQMNTEEKSKEDKSDNDVSDFFSGIALEFAKPKKSIKEAVVDLQGQSKNPAAKHEEPGLPLPSTGADSAAVERPEKKRKPVMESTDEADNARSENVGLSMPVEDEVNQKIIDTISDQLDVDKKKKKKTKKTKTHYEGNVEALHAEASSAKMEKANGVNPDNNASPHIVTSSTGLVKEEIFTGSPSGKIAVQGKKISIRYTVTVKESGQVFNSNSNDNPLKFRLGGEGVSDVWNIGLDGMRVGGKRRLIVPPSMGYVMERDAAKNVPPNSWLVLEVELLKVRR